MNEYTIQVRRVRKRVTLLEVPEYYLQSSLRSLDSLRGDLMDRVHKMGGTELVHEKNYERYSIVFYTYVMEDEPVDMGPQASFGQEFAPEKQCSKDTKRQQLLLLTGE